MTITMRIDVLCLLATLVGSGAHAPRALAQCEVQKLTASDMAQDDEYGQAVAIDGSTALVGAYLHDSVAVNSGAAYVYSFGTSGWVETAKLVAADADFGDAFGRAVAVSGDTALVTASHDSEAAPGAGAAYIFERTPQRWVETQKLFASNASTVGFFGNAASMSGDTAVVGARLMGAAYVFERTPSGWVETARLTASDGANNDLDWFGVSVSLSEDEDTVIVGAYYDDDACVNNPNCNSGSAYIFERTPTGWAETAKLTASDAAAGDQFGGSVAVSANTAVVGSTFDDHAGPASGSAYVFERGTGGIWPPHETVKLVAADASTTDGFGSAVAISGDSILVGAHNDDYIGSAYLFERLQSGWTEAGKLLAGDRSLSDLFGCPVAVCRETVIVGAWADDDACPSNIGCNSGSAYVFTIGDPLGQNYCGPAVVNSSGEPAAIHTCGSDVVADGDFVLRATHLPVDEFGYFLGGLTQGFVPIPPGSQGNLCLAGQIGRFAGSVQNSGPSGTFSLFVDVTSLPPPLQPAVLPGDTWNFQAWFRDTNPGPTSNFTNGVAVTFF